MKTSAKGLALIKQFEGFRQDAYQDVVGVWTIGYGFTKDVKAGDIMSRQKAEARLIRELAEYEAAVLSATGGNCTQNQFDALVCFCWNVGIAGMKKSSVIKAHNRGDYQSAARAFGLWNRAGGKVWPGLTRRRAAESALYLENDTEARQEMPQVVEPERPMAESSINRAGVVAGGTAAVATVAETVNTVSNVKDGVESLGSWLVPVLLLAVVGLCAYIVWERIKQRKGGWA